MKEINNINHWIGGGTSIANQLYPPKRDEYVDFIKGLLIFGVIWGHTITALSLDHFDTGVWIHRFFRVYDMPFFMIISGYFLKLSANKYPLKTLLVNRAGMILLPIIVWNIVRCTFNMMSFYFLWAVFLSSIICGIGHSVGNKISKYIEFIIYLIVIISLHIYDFPWNMFYLFPFFCVGYYMKDTNFKLTTPIFIATLIVFAIGLCFWKSEYTPWSCGFDAWKSDSIAFGIYIYRFSLAIIATYIIANVFKMFYSYIPQNITLFILKAGKETLALYVFQVFVIETVLQKIISILSTSCYEVNPDAIQNIIGYVVAPIISVVTIAILLNIIQCIKRNNYIRWILGQKVI